MKRFSTFTLAVLVTFSTAVAKDKKKDPEEIGNRDVGKGVKRQGRLMRDDTTSQSPGDGRGEIVVFTARQHRHPVHTAAGMLKTPPGGK